MHSCNKDSVHFKRDIKRGKGGSEKQKEMPFISDNSKVIHVHDNKKYNSDFPCGPVVKNPPSVHR